MALNNHDEMDRNRKQTQNMGSRYLQDLGDSVVTMYPTDPNPSDVKAQIKVFFNFSDPVDHINHGSVCRDK